MEYGYTRNRSRLALRGNREGPRRLAGDFTDNGPRGREPFRGHKHHAVTDPPLAQPAQHVENVADELALVFARSGHHQRHVPIEDRVRSDQPTRGLRVDP